MLKVGQEVLCRVEGISLTRGAEVIVPESGTRGTIRLQDVGGDITDIRDAFLPGDLVRVLTLSVGDAKSCFFSTAPLNCGVVLAKAGDQWLQPVDQSHMQNSDTVYRRKVAH